MECALRDIHGPQRRAIALTAAAGVLMLLAGCSHPQAVYYAPPPPGAFASVEQHAFAEGARAAREDIRRGLPPSLERHRRFRQPPFGPPFLDAFRRGFAQGYSAVMHGPPPAY